MEVLAKGLVLHWTNDGKLHQRFLEWKKKVSILTLSTFSTDDRKKWKSISKRLRSNANPEGVNWLQLLSTKCSHKVIWSYQSTSEKCKRITDACGWPEEAKNMALRNAILLRLKNPNVYQKCLEEDQDSLTAERLIQIATLIYNGDCQRSIMQTLSTATVAVTANQQGSTQLHKVQTKLREGGKSAEGPNKGKTPKAKEHEGAKRQSFFCSGATPAHPVRPRISCVTSVAGKATTRSVVKAKWRNPAEPWNTNRLMFMACRRSQGPMLVKF